MRKIFIVFLLLISHLCLKSQSLYTLRVISNSTEKNILTSEIDSITFYNDGKDFLQNIWCNNVFVQNNIKSLDSILVISAPYEYRIFEKKNDGIDAIITSTGDFCTLQEIDNRNESIVAIWGNNIFKDYNYALIDSSGFINTIIIKDNTYDIIYGIDSIGIIKNNNWYCNVSYEDLDNDNIQQANQRKASWVTRNPVYKTLNTINNIIGWFKEPSKKLFLEYIKRYGMGNQTINNILAEIADFDYLTLFEWWDRWLDYDYFGNASIITLDPVKRSSCNYDLSCKVNIPLEETPFFRANKALGVSCSYSLTMVLKDKSIMGKEQSETRHLLDKETYTFNFANLDIQTSYSYEPRLDVEYQISDKAYFLSIGVPENKIKPRVFRRSIYGEEKDLYTGTIGCSVNDANNFTENSADIECTYSNVPDAAQCGVKVTKASEVNTSDGHFYENGSKDGTRTVIVGGLEPCTEYAYIGCVKYKGKEYTSWNAGGFSTTPPDITGTWGCRETHYDRTGVPYYTVYSITIKSDGTISYTNSDGSNHQIDGGSSWGFSCNGTVNLYALDFVMDSYLHWQSWTGTVDNVKNPRKITGEMRPGNWNSVIGTIENDSYYFEMTR